MFKEIIMSIDVGSSSVRSLAFSLKGELLAVGKSEYKTIYEKEMFVEQNPFEWINALELSVKNMVHNMKTQFSVKAIGLTGQSPTYLPLDSNLKPLSNAYTYQDNRAFEEAEQIKKFFGIKYVHDFSGHSVYPFYIIPKILWQKKHMSQVFNKIKYVFQPRDYILLYMTGEIATDESHANPTLAYDIRNHTWNRKFVEKLNIDPDIFPKNVLHPWDIAGNLTLSAAQKLGLNQGIPVIIGAGDSQCCSLGVGAVKPDILSEMSGTSTCLNNTVSSPVNDVRIGNYCHAVPHMYCTEMGLNASGASLNWITNVLYGSGEDKYEKMENELKKENKGSKGIIFFPYISGGERDNPDLKSLFYNVRFDDDRANIIYAVLEGVAFAIREKAEIMENASCMFERIYVSGGGALSDEWNRIKANVFGIPLYASGRIDAAEFGAAMLAAIGCGVFKNHYEAIKSWKLKTKCYIPCQDTKNEYDERYADFLRLKKKFFE